MKAGYLQFQPQFGKPEENISKIKELIRDKEFDLLVMPELANSGYLFTDKNELKELSEKIGDGIFCRALKKISSEKNAYLVSGICERAGSKFYNSSVLVCPDGKIFTYRKIHLFDTEKLWFTPGNKSPEVYEISDPKSGTVKIGMMICFDWFFPETARTLALKGAQIICHPSNLVMSYCQRAMFTRALENRVFTITANRTGKDVREKTELGFTGESVMVSPIGEYLCKGSPDKDEVCIVEINPEDALNKNITQNNNLFKDRRKSFYKT
ncbi:MAG: acyltransferase [Ignavibacteria bacterium]|nr:acyltransferase [Ignavibacteria bacterium]